MAAKADYESMDLDELQALSETIAALLESRKNARRAELIAELEKLGGAPSVRAPRQSKPADDTGRAKPPAKYASKRNADLTWTGRGIKPKWLTAEMAETGETDKEAFRIST